MMRDDETEDDGRLDTSPPARSCAAIGKDIDEAKALLEQADERMREVERAEKRLAELQKEMIAAALMVQADGEQ